MDLIKNFGVDLLEGKEASFLTRSLSIIGSNIFGVNNRNKDAKVKDLSGAYRI